jgi:hypothetical protein
MEGGGCAEFGFGTVEHLAGCVYTGETSRGVSRELLEPAAGAAADVEDVKRLDGWEDAGKIALFELKQRILLLVVDARPEIK